MLFPDTVISGTVDRYFAASMVFKTVSGNFIENLITQTIVCLSVSLFSLDNSSFSLIVLSIQDSIIIRDYIAIMIAM